MKSFSKYKIFKTHHSIFFYRCIKQNDSALKKKRRLNKREEKKWLELLKSSNHFVSLKTWKLEFCSKSLDQKYKCYFQMLFIYLHSNFFFSLCFIPIFSFLGKRAAFLRIYLIIMKEFQIFERKFLKWNFYIFLHFLYSRTLSLHVWDSIAKNCTCWEMSMLSEYVSEEEIS